MSLHRNIWALSATFFLLVALTFFLFWKSQQNTIPEPTELPEVPGIPDEVPQILGEIDTSTWPTYIDPEFGISFKYPTFGRQWAVDAVRSEDTPNKVTFHIGPPSNGHVYVGYNITIITHNEPVNPDDWYLQNVDPNGTMLKSGAFQRQVLSNNAVAFTLGTGGITVDFPVADIYAISQAGSIIIIRLTEDSPVNDLNIAPNELTQNFLAVASSLGEVDWQQAILEGVTIFYPPLWVAKWAGGSLGLKSPATIAESKGAGIDIPSDMGVALLDNPEKMSIEQFIKTFKDGWYTYYANTRTETISGHHAVIVDDLSAGIPKSPIAAALIDDGNKILAIGLYNDKYVDDFNTLINLIKIAP